MEPSDVSDRDEGLRRVVGRKRFKLPRKLLEDCNSIKQASVPRKLRSAMKKRSRESLSPSMPDSRKLKCSIRIGESPKKDGARRSKKQGKSGAGFSVPITKDEEEVVETLYSLAGMFLNNNSACNGSRADKESFRADASAVPGGIKTSSNSAREAPGELKWSVPSYNEEKLSEETMGTHRPDGPRTCEQQKLLDIKPFGKEADSRVETDLRATPSLSRFEKSNHELQASCNFGLVAELTLDSYVNQPEKMDILLPPRKQERKEVAVNGNQLDLNLEAEESQSNGPLLWPGLLAGSVSPHDSCPLQLSTCKIPARLDSASSFSTKPRPVERLFPIEKDVVQVPKSRVDKISQKKCMKHVFISRLIKTLQVPVSKDELALQPNTGRQHRETDQRANTAGPKFSILQNSSSQSFASLILSDSSRNSYEARDVIRQQNRHSQGTKSSSSENECFNFLSLSTSASRPNQKPNVPSVNSIARQQHMSVPLPTSKTYYCPSYTDQLAGFSASHQVQLQLPSYLGNSGRSFLHRGSMVIPKEQHQQMLWAGQLASPQFKPTVNLKAVPQLPTLQNGTIVSWDGSFCCNSSPSSTFLR